MSGRIPIISDLPAHQVRALREGKSISHGGRLLTLKDFDGLAPAAVDSTVRLQRAEARVAELEAELAAVRSAAPAGDLQAHEDLKRSADQLKADLNGVAAERDREKARADDLAQRLAKTESDLREAQDLNEHLSDQVKRAEAADGAKAAAVLEAIAPTSKTELERMNAEALRTYAAYRGIDVEGKDRAALVASLLALREGA